MPTDYYHNLSYFLLPHNLKQWTQVTRQIVFVFQLPSLLEKKLSIPRQCLINHISMWKLGEGKLDLILWSKIHVKYWMYIVKVMSYMFYPILTNFFLTNQNKDFLTWQWTGKEVEEERERKRSWKFSNVSLRCNASKQYLGGFSILSQIF